VGAVIGYCADHDPILAAGSVACGECGAESWPADAEWVTGTLVLAALVPEHEPGCSWRGFPGTVLIDVDQFGERIPAVPRPRRCRGVAVTTGQPCRNHARPGSGYCLRHDPARST
jgi:hypothetical protein